MFHFVSFIPLFSCFIYTTFLMFLFCFKCQFPTVYTMYVQRLWVWARDTKLIKLRRHIAVLLLSGFLFFLLCLDTMTEMLTWNSLVGKWMNKVQWCFIRGLLVHSLWKTHIPYSWTLVCVSQKTYKIYFSEQNL